MTNKASGVKIYVKNERHPLTSATGSHNLSLSRSNYKENLAQTTC